MNQNVPSTTANTSEHEGAAAVDGVFVNLENGYRREPSHLQFGAVMGLKQHLFDDFYLCSDQYQFWVAEERESKKKKRMRRVSGYHATSSNALRSFVERMVKAANLKTVVEQQDMAEKLVTTLSHAVPGRVGYRL